MLELRAQPLYHSYRVRRCNGWPQQRQIHPANPLCLNRRSPLPYFSAISCSHVTILSPAFIPSVFPSRRPTRPFQPRLPTGLRGFPSLFLWPAAVAGGRHDPRVRAPVAARPSVAHRTGVAPPLRRDPAPPSPSGQRSSQEGIATPACARPSRSVRLSRPPRAPVRRDPALSCAP